MFMSVAFAFNVLNYLLNISVISDFMYQKMDNKHNVCKSAYTLVEKLMFLSF